VRASGNITAGADYACLQLEIWPVCLQFRFGIGANITFKTQHVHDFAKLIITSVPARAVVDL
jgi:hypothetical protein